MTEPTNGEKIANSVTLLLVSRFAMILSASALPIAGWMLQRAVSSVDKVSEQVAGVHDQLLTGAADVKLVQQTQIVQQQILADHEARVRVLESHVPKP